MTDLATYIAQSPVPLESTAPPPGGSPTGGALQLLVDLMGAPVFFGTIALTAAVLVAVVLLNRRKSEARDTRG